jgi:cyclic beta-1,2-glucan synthetase
VLRLERQRLMAASGAQEALLKILDDSGTPAQAPIRSEIFGMQRFAQHGLSLALTHEAVKATLSTGLFFPRLESNIKVLRASYEYIGLQARTGYDISPAAEWLLDNFHLIESQLKEIREGLPRRYFRSLPVLKQEPLIGLPRIYGIAWAFVAHTDGDFDEDLLSHFLIAYQTNRELNLSEMWALPTTLRVVLVENLRRLAERVAASKAARELANLCCDQIVQFPTEDLDQLRESLVARGVSDVFLGQIAQRIQDRPASFSATYRDWIKAALPDLAGLKMREAADQAADNLSVSNSISSLRAITDADWPEIVARTSALMQLMVSSPIFEAEHSATRDQTLHDIERLALKSGKSELAIAAILLMLTKSADAVPLGDLPPSSVAGYWLRDGGKAFLAQKLGLTWRLSWGRHAVMPGYLSLLTLSTLALVAWMLHRHGPIAFDTTTALTAILMLFPASEALLAVMNRLISESVKPHHLPRLSLINGIPIEHKVLVVIPGMLTGEASVKALTHRLLLHYLANPERYAQFALLTDWSDADVASVSGDEPILSAARSAIAVLNSKYPGGACGKSRFIILHRVRVYSESEQCWIGWDRKRGKLVQLIAALAQPTSQSPFIDLGADSQVMDEIKYVLTLDSDTQLPPERLRDLVGIAAHPSNKPQVDKESRSVVSGYGILQPRIVTPLPSPTEITLFHWLFSGQCGIDPYSAATSEVYQDVFDEGTFTGKGLINVQAMHAVLTHRLPSDRILSHDLLEGSIARCAVVTDVTLVEGAPFHSDVAAARVHRWTRGDWQLLPFIFGNKIPGLAGINRWKMIDNLRRSLVAPMSLALLFAAAMGTAISLWAAVALVFGAFSAGPIMGAFTGFFSHRENLAKRHFYFYAFKELHRSVLGGLWHMAQLGQQALNSFDAISRALYRMAVSHKNLLQWTTAAASEASAKTDLGDLVRVHWVESALAVSLLLVLVSLSSLTPLALILSIFWCASPLWTWWVCRGSSIHKLAAPEAQLTLEDRAYLEGMGRAAWQLFERCVVAEENHLPPDNLQTSPFDIVAHRTSPTNIGLYLLSTVCAEKFGWISRVEMLQRLQATAQTLGRLQRYRGHFFNWYDTQTCAPLLPMYVSTVDSGNLSGHLLAVSRACLALIEAQESGGAVNGDAQEMTSLRALAQEFEQIAWAADYRFLYHRKRHLFHIGFRVAEQQLDPSFYDLLASESRLTSLLAIAKGDAPVRHWATLGRPFYAVGKNAALRSWSGSMFEYLMPSLVLDEPIGSVLQEACSAAVIEQIAFGLAQRVPWGISESAYAGSDHTLAYQYAPQGVPRLALRRTPPEELVIAPYATALAAQVLPRESIDNFKRIEGLSPTTRTSYGFIEALDFTPSRQPSEKGFVEVDTYMAHHQGMSIVAIANLLLDNSPRRWTMSNPCVEAISSLLHERAPREVSLANVPLSTVAPQTFKKRAPGLLRHVLPGAEAVEPTHVMSNGRYSVTLRPNGAGWSCRDAIGLTRWRDDALRDAYGCFFYVRWDQQPLPVSITQHPAPDPAAQYESTFHADRVCFDALWSDLQVHTTVWVSPEDDVEFRRVELSNLSDRPLHIELMSVFEVTLASHDADEAHPAFSNLFVQAHWQAQHQALVFERKPRLAVEQNGSSGEGQFLAQFLAISDPQLIGLRIQTNRVNWLGRNRLASQPSAKFDGVPFDNELNEPIPLVTGLDPVCGVSLQFNLLPGSKSSVTFGIAAADKSENLHAMIDKYRQSSHVQRASLMSATLMGIRLRSLRISPDIFAAIQTLTTAIVLNLSRPDTELLKLTGGVCDQRLLWRFGLSGERPIVLAFIGVIQGIGLLRTLTQALRIWSWGGIACDLVVINSEPTSYSMEVGREIGSLREQFLSETSANGQASSGQTSFHIMRSTDVSADELSTLQSLARIQMNGDGRPLIYHVQQWCKKHELAFEERNLVSTASVGIRDSGIGAQIAPEPLEAKGAFNTESGDFSFAVSSKVRPVKPWVNVLANPVFGAIISESGGGHSWAKNSRLNQLTAWANDPISDPPAEWFLVQDLKTMRTWSISPSAWGAAGVAYEVVHGQGWSTISHSRMGLDISATWCVDPKLASKQIRLQFNNISQRTLRLRVVAMAEWAMGENRAARVSANTARFEDALFCTQRERAGGFGGGTAFLTLQTASDDDDWTCDRREFFDARGHFVLPDHLGRQAGIGADPCAAISTRFDLEAIQSKECVFFLGFADDEAQAKVLVATIQKKSSSQLIGETCSHWDGLLNATVVKTPDPLFDVMVNRWFLYQALACRLWGKAGFYQAGGAFGYRDQLQDSMALAWAAPNLLREQILLSASRQFVEGDVQHWWHPPAGAGVRTHFSDDLLWLPYACVHYLDTTGDESLMHVDVPFIDGPPIPEGAEDSYFVPTKSVMTANVYEHGARAIDRSLAIGVHGLPLIGSGDWNDGMNRVGQEGKGESVWLAWFLCMLVRSYAPLAIARGQTERAQRWQLAAIGWEKSLKSDAWDGAWFKRAFFDNGEPLGSSVNAEAKIDLIAQAWSVLADVVPSEMQSTALRSMDHLLVDSSLGLVRLLDPPLVHAQPSAGYIQAYPPGVRENGGQYSHGAVWALIAQAKSGNGDDAYRYFTYLSPAHRAANQTYGKSYAIEPYVMAGDVYSQPPYEGRGGWSWYTGAAAWMHRAAIESMFGLKLQADRLSFNPCLPSGWNRSEMTLRRDGKSLRFIFVLGDSELALKQTVLDGARLLLPGESVSLKSVGLSECFVVPWQATMPDQDSVLQA